MIRSNPTAIPLRASDLKLLQSELEKRKQAQQQQQPAQSQTQSQSESQSQTHTHTQVISGQGQPSAASSSEVSRTGSAQGRPDDIAGSRGANGGGNGLGRGDAHDVAAESRRERQGRSAAERIGL
ncbi:hypothetical protein JCM24511_08750 [Saitozyma sp. JCM 24511]|nr:hypothetical protein JCM24511_08750 [Saitozyma sp. JCM 24511]